MAENNNKRKRTSKKQFDIIINYLEENRDIFAFDKNAGSYNKIENKWESLATQLNNCNSGPQKTMKEWKNVISEWKTNVKKKARAINENIKGTGGGPNNMKTLTDIEERLLSLLHKIIIEGAPDVQELGISEQDQPPENPVISTTNIFPIPKMNSSQLEIFDSINSTEVCSLVPDHIILEVNSNTETQPTNSKRKHVSSLQPNTAPKKRTRISNHQIENVLTTHSQHLQMLVESNNNIADSIKYLANEITKSLNHAIVEFKK